jgi:hypothetical protein
MEGTNVPARKPMVQGVCDISAKCTMTDKATRTLDGVFQGGWPKLDCRKRQNIRGCCADCKLKERCNENQ